MYMPYLDGLIIPLASFRIVCFAFPAKLIPRQPLRTDSTMFRATFGKVGSARSPDKQLPSTVKF